MVVESKIRPSEDICNLQVKKEPNCLEPSSREKQILKLAAMGYTHKEIADKLPPVKNKKKISMRTVRADMHSVFDKFGVKNRAEVVIVAIKKGYLNVNESTIKSGKDPIEEYLLNERKYLRISDITQSASHFYTAQKPLEDKDGKILNFLKRSSRTSMKVFNKPPLDFGK